MKTIKYILIISVFFTVSCRKEIDISIPNEERKIVFNTLLTADSVLNANVFRSNHAQDNAVSLLYLNNAKVEVYKDGDFLEILPLDTLGNYRSTSNTAEIGSSYEFRVDVPNLESIKCNTTLLEQISIESIDSIGQTTLYGGNQLYTVYNIVFQDPLAVDNFYRIKFEPQLSMEDIPGDTIFYGENPEDYYIDYPYYIYFDAEPLDPSVEVWSYLDGFFYFNDVLFDGDLHGFQIAIPYHKSYPNGFYVYLEHVDSDFYRYMKSVSAQDETEGMSLFYQAVQVFGNIEGGYGIIGSTTTSRDSLLYESNLEP